MSSEPKLEPIPPDPVKTPAKRSRPSVPVLLRDLPLPPEVVPDVETYCREYRLRKARERQEVEEEFKLQYFFGGHYVIYLSTPEGIKVLVAGDYNSQEFAEQQERLGREVRGRAIVTGVPNLDSDESWI